MPHKQRPETGDNIHGDKHPLLRELEQVLTLVRDASTKTSAKNRLALVRLVEGITLSQWQKIIAHMDDFHWLALPLDKSPLQTLHAMQDEQEILAYQRDHDALTGLANRRCFDRTLAQEMERALRTKSELSLVMLDLDNFKHVNDTYGHPCGDEVLSRLGTLLHHSVRPYDLAARVGGEEFCLILPGASAARAQHLAKRILDNFRNEIFIPVPSIHFSVTFSAGVASLSTHKNITDEHTFVSLADEAMYQAKRQGKDQVILANGVHQAPDTLTQVQPSEKQFLFFGRG